MKLGVILPTFRDNARDALDTARHCADVGIDGVFAYDHLWPMGTPTRPSLAPFPILAAVSQRCPTLHVGPLVARVGMVGQSHLVRQFRSLASLAPGRVVAAMGTGDTKSRDELDAYGLDFSPADDRRRQLRRVADELKDEMTVWIGAGAPATNEMAWDLPVTLNVWDADVEKVRALRSRGPLTWAGPSREGLGEWLSALEAEGVDWAVLDPKVDIDVLANWRR